MRKSVFLLGMIVLISFGLVFVGCDNGTTNTIGWFPGITGGNAIKFTNVDPALLVYDPDFFGVGIFPTTASDTAVIADITDNLLIDMPPALAVAGCDDEDISISGNTVTMPLYAAPAFNSRWKGTGSYNVWCIAADDENNYLFLKSKNPVSFSGGTKEINAKYEFEVIDVKGSFVGFETYYE